MLLYRFLAVFCLFLAVGCVPGGSVTGPEGEAVPADDISPGVPEGGSEFGNPSKPEGGTEFGNPVTLIEGQVESGPPSSAAVLFSLTGFDSLAAPQKSVCKANRVHLVDSEGNSQETDLESNCSFQIEVPADRSYRMTFSQDETFVATLRVGTLGVIPLVSFLVPELESPMKLGLISIEGNAATSQINPLSYSDRDGDGDNDQADADDDNDGIPDTDEPDCDADGFPDDTDLVSVCSGDDPTVLSVTPHNGQIGVGLNDNVRVKLSCAVDLGLFNSDQVRLRLQPDDAPHMAPCSLEPGNSEIVCAPGIPFQPQRTYSVELAETVCNGGDSISITQWSFETL